MQAIGSSNMTIASETTDALLRRKQGLDNFLMMSVANGVPVPAEMEDELRVLSAELDKRGAGHLVLDSFGSWFGCAVGGVRIESLLSESNHGYTFLGQFVDGSAQAVVKVARNFKAHTGRDQLSQLAYFRFVDGMFEVASADCDWLITRQAARMNKLAEALSGLRFPKVTSSGLASSASNAPKRAFYSMPYIEGQTLRQLIELGPLPLDIYLLEIFKKLALALVSMEAAGVAHGNLTPDHVMVTRDGVVLLSPGYHPAMVGQDLETEMIVTTPSYYPLLDGSDLLALGIMFFEAATGVNPLLGSEDKSLEGRASDSLKELIEREVLLGNLGLCSLLRFRAPQEIKAGLSRELNDLLLASIGLGFDSNGQLVPVSSFSSASDFYSALQKLP